MVLCVKPMIYGNWTGSRTSVLNPMFNCLSSENFNICIILLAINLALIDVALDQEGVEFDYLLPSPLCLILCVYLRAKLKISLPC
jgi:hypothetical protein